MDTLPSEIISPIGLYLNNEDRRACTEASKMFRSVHESYYYHDIHMKSGVMLNVCMSILKYKPLLQNITIRIYDNYTRKDIIDVLEICSRCKEIQIIISTSNLTDLFNVVSTHKSDNLIIDICDATLQDIIDAMNAYPEVSVYSIIIPEAATSAEIEQFSTYISQNNYRLTKLYVNSTRDVKIANVSGLLQVEDILLFNREYATCSLNQDLIKNATTVVHEQTLTNNTYSYEMLNNLTENKRLKFLKLFDVCFLDMCLPPFRSHILKLAANPNLTVVIEAKAIKNPHIVVFIRTLQSGKCKVMLTNMKGNKEFNAILLRMLLFHVKCDVNLDKCYLDWDYNTTLMKLAERDPIIADFWSTLKLS